MVLTNSAERIVYSNSGRLLANGPCSLHRPQLERVFTTIGERTAHLTSFIDGYARFAKLPRPRPTVVSWPDFLGRLEGTGPYRVEGELPRSPASFDVSQLEQVMINLLKNAAESGSAGEEIVVSVRAEADGFLVEVADRGSGLAEEVLRDALLPFYSTKPTGTGLGYDPPVDVILKSELTCPHCGHRQVETMPTDACQFFYDCVGCGTVLRPKTGDCCVFCSYGSVACPPKQADSDCCRS